MSSKAAPFRTFGWAWFFYMVLIAGLAIVVWVPSGIAARMDFRSMYAAGELARTDPSHLFDLARQKEVQEELVSKNGPFLPFGHLAPEALLFEPLSLLQYKTAYLIFMLCNGVLLLLCFAAARPEFSTPISPWQPRPGWMFFSFFPTAIALAQGQDSLLLLFVACVVWKALKAQRHFGAGLVLAMMLFKPHLALLLAILLTVQYGWRFIAGFAAGSSLVAALCIPFLRHGGWKIWLGVLWQSSLSEGHKQAEQAAVAVYPWSMANLRGLLFTVFGSRISPHAFVVILAAVSLAVLVWACMRVGKLPKAAAFAFSAVCAVLLSYHFHPGDSVLFLLPLAMLEPVRNKVLLVARDAMFALPVLLPLFAWGNRPGACYCLICIPVLVSALVLGSTSKTVTQAAEMPDPLTMA